MRHPQRSRRGRTRCVSASTGAAALVVGALLACAPRNLPAADDPRASATAWPQYKGDAARTGDNPQARLAFPLRRTTAVRFPAPIYASPAVSDGRVWIQDARGHLACVDAAANRVAWTAENGGLNNTSSPAVFDGRVYVGSTAGHLAIHRAATGELLLRVPAKGPVIASPAVANGAVYFSTLDGRLTKLAPDGTVRWTFDGGHTSIVEFAVQGDRIVFVAGSKSAVPYLLRDRGDKVEVLGKDEPERGYFAPTGGPVFLGEEGWACQSYDSESGWFHGLGKTIEVGSNDSRLTPSVRGNVVHRGNRTFEFDLESKKFREIGQADPQVLYDGAFHSSPALGAEVLAIGTEKGHVHFFPLAGNERPADGERPKPTVRKALWSFATEQAGRPNGAVSSSPALIDGRVYFGGEDGILYGLGPGNEVPIVAAKFDDAPSPRAAPSPLAGPEWRTAAGDMGFSGVAHDSPAQPPFRIRWRTRTWSTHKGNMVVAAGKVFAAGRTGPLVALDAESGEILWKTHHAGVESRPAPTFADDRLYVLRSRGGIPNSPYFKGWYGGPNGEGLWCHDPATGNVLWHKPIPTAYHYNSDGVIAADGRVFACEEGTDKKLAAAAYDGRTGDLLWRKDLPGVEAYRPWRAKLEIRRYCGVLSDGLWCLSIRGDDRSPGVTLALDQKTGVTVWRNDAVHVVERSRIAARNGTLVVFDANGSHGFEAKSGKVLWTGTPIVAKSRQGNASATFYMNPLTDRFLESQGKEDTIHLTGCILPLRINGLWYSHLTNGSHVLHAYADGKTLWQRSFLSHACPSPAPAYGRLYYSPNSEGVVYCFENDDAKNPDAAPSEEGRQKDGGQGT